MNHPISSKIRSLAAAMAVAAAFSAGLSTARADLLAYESFNYATGASSLNGKTGDSGWTGGWGNGANFNVVPGLSYAGLQSGGNAASGSGQTYLHMNSLVAPSAGSVYIAFLTAQVSANFDNLTVFNSTAPSDQEMFSFGDTYTGSGASTVYSLYSSSGLGNLGYLASGVSVDTTGATHLMVAQLDYSVPGSTTVYFYKDPTLGSTPDTGTAIATFTAAASGAFDRIRLEDRNFAIDEIRIGTTFADVTPVPEPSICASMLMGLCGLAGSRWLRRR